MGSDPFASIGESSDWVWLVWFSWLAVAIMLLVVLMLWFEPNIIVVDMIDVVAVVDALVVEVSDPLLVVKLLNSNQVLLVVMPEDVVPTAVVSVVVGACVARDTVDVVVVVVIFSVNIAVVAAVVVVAVWFETFSVAASIVVKAPVVVHDAFGQAVVVLVVVELDVMLNVLASKPGIFHFCLLPALFHRSTVLFPSWLRYGPLVVFATASIVYLRLGPLPLPTILQSWLLPAFVHRPTALFVLWLRYGPRVVFAIASIV
mmetsp:Transcript_61310/g.115902  ORF Transcript_61310/g.115902 Transcript_61310/m.115902 type:complete len:259 (-) Transcript_61310:292-1068(-)